MKFVDFEYCIQHGGVDSLEDGVEEVESSELRIVLICEHNLDVVITGIKVRYKNLTTSIVFKSLLLLCSGVIIHEKSQLPLFLKVGSTSRKIIKCVIEVKKQEK